MLYKITIYISNTFAKISRVFRLLASNFTSEEFQFDAVSKSTQYDMVASVDEPYYLEQYWGSIVSYLGSIPSDAKVLDLGCSQGRFSMRMAAQFPGGIVEGCDLSLQAIEAAKKYAERLSLQNIQFEHKDIKKFLATKKSGYYDIILLMEVTIFYPGWLDDLSEIKRVLKPGGILILANRSQYFDALCIAKNRQLSQANLLLCSREGDLFETGSIFTWQTSKEIEEIVIKRLNFDLLQLSGIGVCSGIPGDPHDYCRPSLLDDGERMQLMGLELELGRMIPDAGRYILAISQKPLSSN